MSSQQSMPLPCQGVQRQQLQPQPQADQDQQFARLQMPPLTASSPGLDPPQLSSWPSPLSTEERALLAAPYAPSALIEVSTAVERVH
jgi:hypothetical protein